jgi:hypothetical protein
MATTGSSSRKSLYNSVRPEGALSSFCITWSASPIEVLVPPERVSLTPAIATPNIFYLRREISSKI